MSQQRRALDDFGEFTTAIGHGARFVGALSGHGNYAVDGDVDGECNIDGTLILQEHGTWRGTLQAKVVVIAGRVDGQIVAAEKLELTRSARVQGDVAAPVIAIAEGAKLDGRISMQGSTVTRYTERRDTHPPQARIDTG